MRALLCDGNTQSVSLSDGCVHITLHANVTATRLSSKEHIYTQNAQTSDRSHIGTCHLRWIGGVVVRLSNLRLAVVGSNPGHSIAGFFLR